MLEKNKRFIFERIHQWRNMRPNEILRSFWSTHTHTHTLYIYILYTRGGKGETAK